MQNIYELLCGCAGGENVRRQEPMSLHTTFRIGGPADLFVMPGSIQAVADSIRICKETQTPYAVIGNGSNLLVSDAGYRGVIIQIGRNLNQITGNGEEIRAQAGAMLSVIAKTALLESLTGFEFASGIPGTLGGAVVMNAGAYGGEMKDVLTEVTVLTREGEIRTIPAEKLELGIPHKPGAEKRLDLHGGSAEISKRRCGGDPQPDGGTESAARHKAAAGSAERGQHV